MLPLLPLLVMLPIQGVITTRMTGLKMKTKMQMQRASSGRVTMLSVPHLRLPRID